MFQILLAISKLFPSKLIFKRSAKEKTTTENARHFFEKSMSQMGKQQFLWMLGGQLEACQLTVPAPHQPLLITHGEHEMPRSLVNGNKEWQ